MARIDRRNYNAYRALAETRLSKRVPPVQLPKPPHVRRVRWLLAVLCAVVALGAVLARWPA